VNRLRRAARSEWAVALATGLATAAAVVAVRTVGWLEVVELQVHDRLLRLRPQPAEPGRRVAMVGYTETDIMSQAVYPVPDETLARVLQTLLDHGAAAVGVDFYRDVLIPPGSEQLEAVLRGDPRVVMIELVAEGDKPAVPPPAVLRGTSQVGYSDQKLDRDDTVRRAILFQDGDDGTQHLSLALQVALRWLEPRGVGFGADPEDESRVRLGETTLPRFGPDDGGYTGADARGYQMLIDWDGNAPFPMVSMADVLSGAARPERFRDKVVLVGAVAESIADLRRTPFGLWPGVFVHGHIAEQLVRYGLGEARPIGVLPEVAESAWIALWGLLGAGLGLLRRSAWVFVAGAGLGAVAVAGVGFAALLAGWWLPVAPPALAWLVSASAVTAWISRRESAERKVLMQLFARNVSRTVAGYLWENRDQFMQGGRPRPQRQVVTVLFVDVKSFTPISEGLDAVELMNWVNDLMEVLASTVEAHGGFVDDYFGDGLKAAFGVPLPRASTGEEDADVVTAVRCAQAMEAQLADQNARWQERGLPIGRLRAGIDSGDIVVGSVGSSQRLKYTVLGDVANTAARIQGIDDAGHDFEKKPVRILVSGRAHQRLHGRFETRDLGEVELKGKARPVHVFEVLGEAGAAPRA
jgi:adenylate cyclase